jgi:hypothetical protein
MKKWMFQNKLYLIGALLGSLGGVLYWKFIGCLTGSCAITSSPLNSTLYFAFFGAFLPGSFKKKEKALPRPKTEA